MGLSRLMERAMGNHERQGRNRRAEYRSSQHDLDRGFSIALSPVTELHRHREQEDRLRHKELLKPYQEIRLREQATHAMRADIAQRCQGVDFSGTPVEPSAVASREFGFGHYDRRELHYGSGSGYGSHWGKCGKGHGLMNTSHLNSMKY